MSPITDISLNRTAKPPQTVHRDREERLYASSNLHWYGSAVPAWLAFRVFEACSTLDYLMIISDLLDKQLLDC
jgi:hypothetical protein